MTIPDYCQRPDCVAPVATWCPLCGGCYCLPHDELPDGHTCLSTYNVLRQIDEDEVPALLERFRPLP